jgi:hypothetical protein
MMPISTPVAMAAPVVNGWERAQGEWWYVRENGQLTWAWSEQSGYWYPFDTTTGAWGPARYASKGYQPLAVARANP